MATLLNAELTTAIEKLTNAVEELQAFLKRKEREEVILPVIEKTEPLTYDEWESERTPSAYRWSDADEETKRFRTVEYARYLCKEFGVGLDLCDGKYVLRSLTSDKTGDGIPTLALILTKFSASMGSGRLNILQNLFTTEE